jgi:hypothetical protein
MLSIIPSMKLPDRQRWQRLGPLLDDLLDLDVVAQVQRLALLHAYDEALAGELRQLLQSARDAEASGFLVGHALDGKPWLRR